MTEFRILGPLEMHGDHGPVAITGTRQRALLAILLLHAGEAVSTDRLMDELWGDEPPEAGAAALRVRVSQLRRALGPAGELLVTRPPGYVLAVADDEFDLRRFEHLVEAGDAALAAGDPGTAAERLGAALTLWRGPPLADFSYAPFAQGAIVRLEELRLAAIELRGEAELRLGRHARLAGELRALVGEHPLRERLWGQLMLALYRDGRQTEALETYRAARRRLVDGFGLEPGPELAALERRILAQDAGLDLAARSGEPAPAARARVVLVLAAAGSATEALVGLAAPLARGAGHELVIADLLDDAALLPERSGRLNRLRAQAEQGGATARAAAFTSDQPGADALRLAADEDVSLVLLDLPEVLPGRFAPLLEQPVCDVALVAGADRATRANGGAVIVPFGGHPHDWAAAELGAWFASATGAVLRLVGARADRRGGRRDASRLLGHASLALQRALGVSAEPVLADPGTPGIVAAAHDAALVVVGLSERFPRDGLGPARTELAHRAAAPVLLVRRGLRPGGLAPPRALTRFTWSVG
jgi:DNA-binding SARP family transcriptional activator